MESTEAGRSSTVVTRGLFREIASLLSELDDCPFSICSHLLAEFYYVDTYKTTGVARTLARTAHFGNHLGWDGPSI